MQYLIVMRNVFSSVFKAHKKYDLKVSRSKSYYDLFQQFHFKFLALNNIGLLIWYALKMSRFEEI